MRNPSKLYIAYSAASIAKEKTIVVRKTISMHGFAEQQDGWCVIVDAREGKATFCMPVKVSAPRSRGYKIKVTVKPGRWKDYLTY